MKEESTVSHTEYISQPASITTGIEKSEVGFVTHENTLVSLTLVVGNINKVSKVKHRYL